jgi:hypothetical protein
LSSLSCLFFVIILTRAIYKISLIHLDHSFCMNKMQKITFVLKVYINMVHYLTHMMSCLILSSSPKRTTFQLSKLMTGEKWSTVNWYSCCSDRSTHPSSISKLILARSLVYITAKPLVFNAFQFIMKMSFVKCRQNIWFCCLKFILPGIKMSYSLFINSFVHSQKLTFTFQLKYSDYLVKTVWIFPN